MVYKGDTALHLTFTSESILTCRQVNQHYNKADLVHSTPTPTQQCANGGEGRGLTHKQLVKALVPVLERVHKDVLCLVHSQRVGS